MTRLQIMTELLANADLLHQVKYVLNGNDSTDREANRRSVLESIESARWFADQIVEVAERKSAK